MEQLTILDYLELDERGIMTEDEVEAFMDKLYARRYEAEAEATTE